MCYYQQDNRMKCDLPGLYVQPRGGVKGLKDGECTVNTFHGKRVQSWYFELFWPRAKLTLNRR